MPRSLDTFMIDISVVNKKIQSDRGRFGGSVAPTATLVVEGTRTIMILADH